MYTYKAKQLKDHTSSQVWWVVASSEDNEEIKMAKVPHWMKHPKAVAIAIADSLNRNSKLRLVDLV